MYAQQFDLRAIKVTEFIFRASIVKEGVTEGEIRLGIADQSIVVDQEKHEIRRKNGEVLAKFGDTELPLPVWKVSA